MILWSVHYCGITVSYTHLLLYLCDVPISMASLLGFLMLVGTVVNNGILYVDTVNQYRQTMDKETALIEAGATRLRPILMTTLTTVVSMIPMAMAYGDSGESMQGLAPVSYTHLMQAVFDDSLITGNKMIDTQHKELIDRINKLLILCENEKPAKREAVETLDYLADYTEFHFGEEEKLQEEIGYPGIAEQDVYKRQLLLEGQMVPHLFLLQEN